MLGIHLRRTVIPEMSQKGIRQEGSSSKSQGRRPSVEKYSTDSHQSKGKWMPNYEGPYVVRKFLSGGALILSTMDGEDLPSPVNKGAVKKYYA